MSKIKIGWLFPDTLYLHGERGNILALERFVKLAGLAPETVKIDFKTENFDPMDYDILFCPPGELVSFPVILEWLAPYRGRFAKFVEAGRPLFATGTSVALWCGQVRRADGSLFSGMEILNATAEEKESVYGDDIYFSCQYGEENMEIIGNQIQMVDLLGEEEEPFGTMFYGYGNTGRDRNEGFKKRNSVFTNALGPVLATNPWLTAEIVRIAAENRGIALQDAWPDMGLEEKSFETKKEFILTKETKLTNCGK